MKKFFRYFGSALLAGLFFFIGYRIFSGNPFPDQGITYGGIDPNEVQDWLISKLGEAGTGISIMCFGAVVFFMASRDPRRNEE
jgi:hypothetical protein